MQAWLLKGDTFKEIDHIESDGLNDLYNVLLSGNISKEIYGKDIQIKEKQTAESELSRLRNEQQRMERALDRLNDIYLYSENSMSEAEYISHKNKITNTLDEISEQIGFASSDGWQQSISDETFINETSQFIISQKLNDRNYISYKRLAMSVDSKVIQSFVQSIIDSITMDKGNIKQIIFKNGLSHTFVYK